MLFLVYIPKNLNRFRVCTSLSGNQNFCYNYNDGLQLGEWHNLKASQRYDDNGAAQFTVRVNNATVFTQENTEPMSFSSVTAQVASFWTATPPSNGCWKNFNFVPNLDETTTPVVTTTSATTTTDSDQLVMSHSCASGRCDLVFSDGTKFSCRWNNQNHIQCRGVKYANSERFKPAVIIEDYAGEEFDNYDYMPK